MSNLAARINRLEKAEGVCEAGIRSVHFVGTPEEARPGDANAASGLWGGGNGAWHVFKAPGQTEEDALRAVGIDTEKADVIIWTPVG